MAADNEALLRVLNDSGFPLQIAVDQAVMADQYWRTLYREHAWRTHTGTGGFIDLVLVRSDNLFIVVECKRVMEADWIFLAESGDTDLQLKGKAWVTRLQDKRTMRNGWTEARTLPGSPEALFCAVRGQSNERGTMIERVAAELVAATEALALEHLALLPRARHDDHFALFLPVIVTTARLHVAAFQPGAIPLDTGKLADADFREVPYLRFRKQLRWEEVSDGGSPYGTDVASTRESVVHVVHAPAIGKFLRNFDIDIQDAQRLKFGPH